MAAPVSPDSGLAIAALAEAWVGTPYRHQGASREGCDCLGLVRGVWRDWTGEDEPESAPAYAIDWFRDDPGMMIEAATRHLHAVPKGEGWRPGDVLMFRIRGSKAPRHAGIVAIDPARMVHAYAAHSMDRSSVALSRIAAWRGDVAAIFRFTG